jgi:2,4'-dihydroxyacetophenone dioxygenase
VALTTPRTSDAIHLGDADLPWAAMEDGSRFKVVQVRRSEGLWITHSRFRAGYGVQTHRHTGPVFGYTVSGAWKYREYEYVNRAGSFLYEPANSVHTLTVLEDAEVWFHLYGALLNLDAEGRIESVADGTSVLEAYRALCEAQGLERPAVLED